MIRGLSPRSRPVMIWPDGSTAIFSRLWPAEHVIEVDEAEEMAVDLAYNLVKAAYRL